MYIHERSPFWKAKEETNGWAWTHNLRLLLLIFFLSFWRSRRKWWLKFTKNWKFMFAPSRLRGERGTVPLRLLQSVECLRASYFLLSASISKFLELLRPERRQKSEVWRHKLFSRNSNHFRAAFGRGRTEGEGSSTSVLMTCKWAARLGYFRMSRDGHSRS